MRGFWAVTLFVLGAVMLAPGLFIWPLGILSMLSMSGAMAVTLWSDGEVRRPVAIVFAWMCGFVLLAGIALQIVRLLS